MFNHTKARENQSIRCSETVSGLIRAIYNGDGEQLAGLLSQNSRSQLRRDNIPPDKEALSALAGTIRAAWNCPGDRVLVLAADFDHPHLEGRVRVPVILDHQGAIPEGHILSAGAPLPLSCGAVCVLLVEEGGGWKVDNITALASCTV